ncbi:iron uptake system component EfeO/high-affinity iron transporter [Streptosporangium subroseum]|uniref:Iron uptake system component EfeO/high-affinity iron transporter n=1 Tax=Streptosporangium subroseum TaxID=106412 RepID=A0A239NJ93_9ACTN|nr:EfeM/EfeO family lipoprotein [Streptosporangium subroseum]SNT54935.1 iron uptake system component EfeO/high-affinity iron transporter [Streptosporangium subroseum]
MTRPAWPSAARRALLAAIVLLPLAGCTSDPAPDASPSTAEVAPPAAESVMGIARSVCGTSWTGHGGDRTFLVKNTDTVTTDVELVDPGNGAVYAEVESLAPGTTRSLRVRLGHGAYALRCLPEGVNMLTGPTVRITDGPQDGTPAVLPVDDQDLTGAVGRYRKGVTAGLAVLSDDVAVLRRALHHGDRADARTAWLTAHLGYERLGAAYGTFDEFADRIDGLPDSLPGGVHDKDFSGFYRIEYGLWHGESPSSLAPVGDRLASDVAKLRHDFPEQRTDPMDLPLRAHEILEDTLQSQLTAAADQGSGTGLATAEANLDGTQAVLDAIAPVMRSRYAGWDQVGVWMGRARRLLKDARRPGGGWTPVASLKTIDRRRLDGTIGALLEELAPIAAIGETRRTS